MKLSGPMRLLLALAAILGILAVAAAAVSFAGSLAEVWESLRAGPVSIFAGLVVFLLAFVCLGGWLVWRLLFPARRRREQPRPALDGESLVRRIEEGREQGLYFPASFDTLDDVPGLLECPFVERSTAVIEHLVGDEIETGTLRGMVESAFDFPLEVPLLDDGTHALELFHGPFFFEE